MDFDIQGIQKTVLIFPTCRIFESSTTASLAVKNRTKKIIPYLSHLNFEEPPGRKFKYTPITLKPTTRAYF